MGIDGVVQAGVRLDAVQDALHEMVDVLDFSFDASEYPKLIGKKFQVLFVEYDPVTSRSFRSAQDRAFALRQSTFAEKVRQKKRITTNFKGF